MVGGKRAYRYRNLESSEVRLTFFSRAFSGLRMALLTSRHKQLFKQCALNEDAATVPAIAKSNDAWNSAYIVTTTQYRWRDGRCYRRLRLAQCIALVFLSQGQGNPIGISGRYVTVLDTPSSPINLGTMILSVIS